VTVAGLGIEIFRTMYWLLYNFNNLQYPYSFLLVSSFFSVHKAIPKFHSTKGRKLRHKSEMPLVSIRHTSMKIIRFKPSQGDEF
jgi:hypothetical protein